MKPLLAKLQINTDDAYENPLAYVTALHRTLIAELPPLYRPKFRDYKVRELSNRAGPDIVLSFMSDLAMLDIDVALKSIPGCFVGLNLDPTDSDMTFWRRPCLLGLTDRLFPKIPEIFCVEESYFGDYSNMDRPSRLTHPDAIVPATYSDTIGGWMLIRLDRYIVHPNLEELKRTTWLGEAETV